MTNRWLLPAVFLLTSCAAAEPTPPYLVRVGSPAAYRCGGYAIDARHIVTANHCGIVTVAKMGNGAEVGLILAARWPEIDAALYETAVAMRLDTYATFRPIAPAEMAYAFGYCPRWRASVARFAQYTSTETTPLRCHQMHIPGAWVCSGDSGGIVTQGGAIVGMIAQFRGNSFAAEDGPTVAYSACAVTSEAIAAKVEEWRDKQ